MNSLTERRIVRRLEGEGPTAGRILHHRLSPFRWLYLGAGVLVVLLMATLVLMLWLSDRQGD